MKAAREGDIRAKREREREKVMQMGKTERLRPLFLQSVSTASL